MCGMEHGARQKGSNGIGELRESSLHAEMKRYLARPTDRFEQRVGTHVIDIVREECLIEIQTTSFAKLRPKLSALLSMHPIRVVFPIAVDKWIVQLGADGELLRRRRSPRRGKIEDLLRELTQIVGFVENPNLSVEVLFVAVDEIRRDDGKGSWRRRGVSIIDRRLIEVKDRTLFRGPADYLRFLPGDLPQLFTNSELSQLSGRDRREAQTITYCLRRMGMIEVEGKRGRELQYRRRAAEPRTKPRPRRARKGPPCAFEETDDRS